MFAKLANNRKIEEATSAKDDVAPIYVLDEIADLASGGGEVAQGLADATVRRLGNKSPVVKQKALRLIKHVTNKGASEYRRAICKQAKDIRDLTHYRGEPDPFKGDVLNQKVRDAAKETLDAIFQATDTNYSSTAKPTLTNRIQGFGSANSSEPDHASSSRGNMGSYSGGFSSNSNTNSSSNGTGGGMVGFGNPRFNNPSSKPSLGSSSSSKWLPASVANKLDSLSMLPKDRPGGLRYEGNGGYSSGDDSPSRHSNSTYTRPAMPQDSQRSPLTATPTYSQATPSGRAGSGIGDAAHLVDDMCTPGGLRAQPDREDLRLFVENAASLNGTYVAERLQAKMESGSWQEVLRALCALEAVISQGSSAACGEIAVHFQANAEVVRNAMKSPQASVRQCAMRVFKLLGGETLPEASSGAAGSAAAAAAAPDLMGDLLGEADSPAAAPASQDFLGDLLGGEPPAPSAAATSGGGMFAGLDVGTSDQRPSQSASVASPVAPQSPIDALASLQMPSSAQSGSAAFGGQQADMFGGLSLEAPSDGPNQSGMDALLGIGSSPQAPAQAPAQSPAAAASADLFGGLSVGDTGPTSTAPAPNAPSGATSTAADLEGLFTTASPSSQAATQGASPQLWPPSSSGQARGGMGSPQAGMGMQDGFPQPGMGMQPGAQMGYMPGYSGGMMQPGMMQPGVFPAGMMPTGMHPGMLQAMQFAHLGPGGMPSGQMPQNPTNPLQGLSGVPSAQMEYLQRQMQSMGMQRPQGMGQQPYPGQQMHGGQSQLNSAGSSGLSDFLSGTAPQGSGPNGPEAKTDLLGRALSSHKQDSFDFIGEHMGKLKK